MEDRVLTMTSVKMIRARIGARTPSEITGVSATRRDGL